VGYAVSLSVEWQLQHAGVAEPFSFSGQAGSDCPHITTSGEVVCSFPRRGQTSDSYNTQFSLFKKNEVKKIFIFTSIAPFLV
jgi:hypothetical protein